MLLVEIADLPFSIMVVVLLLVVVVMIMLAEAQVLAGFA